MADGPPPTNYSSLPFDARVVSVEPRESQNQRQAGLVQDVELDLFQVVAGEEHVYWSGLVGDNAQPVAIQGPDRNRLQQGLSAQSQLLAPTKHLTQLRGKCLERGTGRRLTFPARFSP